MQVFAYVTSSINRTTLFDSIVVALKDFGIHVNLDRMLHRYYDNIYMHRNIITWGVKLPLEWYRKYPDKNILFCENGLLNQSAAMTCDHTGLYDNSIVSRDLSEPNNDEIEKMKEKVSKRFGLDLFDGYDKSGPIIIAMQMIGDAPVKHNFVRDPIYNSWELFIKICREYIHNKDVIIRCHPRDEPNEVYGSIRNFIPQNWKFVGSKGSIYDILPNCRSMVAINSTVATEALVYGMPVATLGRGAFTNHGATLECSDDHSLLSGIDDYKPDYDKIIKYLCSVSRYEMPYNTNVDGIMSHHCFKAWLDIMLDGFKDCLPDHKVKPVRNKRVAKNKFADKIKKIKKSI
jgi:hypothetical protein